MNEKLAESLKDNDLEIKTKHIQLITETLKMASSVYIKGTSFYILIMSGINLYALSEYSTDEVRDITATITLIVSLIFGLGLAAGLYGMWKGLEQLENVYKGLDERLFIENKIGDYFVRGKAIFLLSAFLIILILVAIAISFYFRSR